MIEKLSLYRSFSAVARHGSISAASRELFVSQPAVSADIMELEKELGVRLFFRTNRGMNLTEEGRLLDTQVERAFSLLDAGESVLRDITGLRRGHLRIGASDMTLRFFLLDDIGAFCEQYPDVRLSVTNNPTPQTLAALRAGTIDFGVVSAPLEGGTDDLTVLPVRMIHDIFVVSPRHPLAASKSVTPDGLRQFSPLIMLERQTSTRRYLRTLPGYADLEADIELATSDLLIEFARRGIGVSAVVEDFALPAIADGTLCRVGLAVPPPPRPFLLVYLKRMPLSVAAATLIRRISERVSGKVENK